MLHCTGSVTSVVMKKALVPPFPPFSGSCITPICLSIYLDVYCVLLQTLLAVPYSVQRLFGSTEGEDVAERGGGKEKRSGGEEERTEKQGNGGSYTHPKM